MEDAELQIKETGIADALALFLSKERLMRANAVLVQFCAKYPEFERILSVPQTPPEHNEGPEVRDHLLRMLSIIDAIAAGESFSACVELQGDTLIQRALIEAEHSIRTAPNLYMAYTLMHDIAKPDRLFLVAEQGSAGEQEGFVHFEKRAREFTTKEEIVRFDKLRRAGLASGIVATYSDADRAIIGPQYADLRKKITDFFGLEHAFIKFLTEVCWSRKDAIEFFQTKDNEQAFCVFPARAGKAGLHVERFLDALNAVVLLDHDLGRVGVQPAGFNCFQALIRTEYVAIPERSVARDARIQHAKKVRVKEILAQAQLSADDVFSLVHTPLGPERGVAMHHIYAWIRAEEQGEYFQDVAAKFEARILKARAKLAEEGLSV